METRAIWRWLPFLTVVAASGLALVAVDTSVLDIVRFAAYWAWCLVLPGTLAYRALRSTRHSLVDDLAMGAALGLVLEIGVYLLLSWLDLRQLLPFWPLLVILIAMAIPQVRRRVLAGGGTRPSLSWSWGVAGVYLFLLAYLFFCFLRPVSLSPAVNEEFHIDLLYFLGIIAESKQHFPLEIPAVAGSPLNYHWFAYAHMGIGSTVSGVEAPVVLFRTSLLPLSGLAVALMAVTGWRVSGRMWTGVGAAALTFAVGELSFGSLSWSALGGQVAYTHWASPSVVYSAVITLAIIALTVDLLRRFHLAQLILLLLFIFAAPGGKSTVLPVVLCAIGMVCLVQLFTRKFSWMPWLIAVVVLATIVTSMIVLFGLSPYGVVVDPFATLRHIGNDGYVATFAALMVFWGARLAGIPLAIWLRGRSFSTAEWFLLGGTIGGFAAALLLSHVTLSQLFFLRTAFLFGAILSAIGVTALVDRLAVAPKQVWYAAAGGTAVSVAVWLGFYVFADAMPKNPSEYLWRILGLGLAIGLAAAIIAVAAWLSGRRRALLVAVFVVLSGGIVSLPADAYYFPDMHGYWHQQVGPPQRAAATWIRQNTSSDDLLATNGHCAFAPATPGPVKRCLHLSFWLSGFGERRVLLEGWSYTDEALIDLPGPYRDPEMERINDEMFSAPTAATAKWMKDHGVRTLVADRRYGNESPDLAKFADLKWEQDYLAIYVLR